MQYLLKEGGNLGCVWFGVIGGEWWGEGVPDKGGNIFSMHKPLARFDLDHDV